MKKITKKNSKRKKINSKREKKKKLDPTRYGDWEKKGRCIDFF